jgi:hypothetical protein
LDRDSNLPKASFSRAGDDDRADGFVPFEFFKGLNQLLGHLQRHQVERRVVQGKLRDAFAGPLHEHRSFGQGLVHPHKPGKPQREAEEDRESKQLVFTQQSLYSLHGKHRESMGRGQAVRI